MLEAIEISRILLTSLFLITVCITDFKKKRISLLPIILFAVIGILLLFVSPLEFEYNLTFSMLFGFVSVYLVTVRLMGIGDLFVLGVMFLLSGTISLSERELTLFTPIINGMFVAIVIAMYYVGKRFIDVLNHKAKLKDPLQTKSIPFIPFILIGYLITVFYGDIIINSMPEVVYSLI